MQCAYFILSSVACPVLHHFSTLCHKRQDFRNKNIECKMCFFFSLQLLAETFLILRRTDQDKIKNIYWSFVKYPSFLSDFNERWIFSSEFREILKNIKFHGNPSIQSHIIPCGPSDRLTELIFPFRNFAKARKMMHSNLRKLCSYVEKTIRWM